MKFIGWKKVWNKSCWKWFKLLFHISFYFDVILRMREVGPKNMHFFTVIEKFVKNKIVYSFLAITASFFRFHRNKKICYSNFNYFRKLLFHTFFHPMNFIFLILVLILKTKIGRRTQKSAANDANILVGCISNPKNIYFEVCLVR